jgi:tetratricopeptide (TPR) repeat protein
MPDYFDLGPYRRDVTTASPEAALWFNRGLIWTYAFHHEEAIRCHERALKADPLCAMAWWGIAYATGPYYNKPWEWYADEERGPALKRCFEATANAKALLQSLTKVEQDLVTALDAKFPQSDFDSEDQYALWTKNFAIAMRKVGQVHAHDLDVQALTAEALMTQNAWDLWDVFTNEPKENADTLEAVEVIENGLTLVDDLGLDCHPGLSHLYIHVMEMSSEPHKAYPAANKLRTYAPDTGHLVHMPSHLDLLCGDYAAAISSNNAAIEADRRYLSQAPDGEFYLISCSHDIQIKMAAAMLMGHWKATKEAIDRLEEILTIDVLKDDKPYFGRAIESYRAMNVHGYVRFGKWQEIIDLPLEQDDVVYKATNAMLVYAKTISYAALKRIEEAEGMKSEFLARIEQFEADHPIGNNTADDVLTVAKEMMLGEFEYHKGNTETGFEHLRTAVQLCDKLNYSEPWDWMHPPRHALAALLQEQGQLEEALQVNKADLGLDPSVPRCCHHPRNIWALKGAYDCLIALGKFSEANELKPQLDEAQSLTDFEVRSACCCAA